MEAPVGRDDPSRDQGAQGFTRPLHGRLNTTCAPGIREIQRALGRTLVRVAPICCLSAVSGLS